MKIGYVQSAPIFGNKRKNFEQIDELITKEKADLIVLPELFATGLHLSLEKKLIT